MRMFYWLGGWGLVIGLAVGCKSQDEATDNSDIEKEDQESDGDSESEKDTEPDDGELVHHGCVEAEGQACLDIEDEATCSATEHCHFGYHQCLPDGFGCREQQTEDECDGLNYCVFKTWEDRPCMWRCALYDDESTCTADAECVWEEQFGGCYSPKSFECMTAEDKDSCEALEYCQHAQYCVPLSMCEVNTDEESCEKQEGCSWDSEKGACRFECETKHTDQESCEADEELSCMWDMINFLCTGNPWEDLDEEEEKCFQVEIDECAANEKCGVLDYCQMDWNKSCDGMTGDQCKDNPDCVAGLCEHRCTPKKSKHGCESIDGCMWIPVYFEPGQTCTTACH